MKIIILMLNQQSQYIRGSTNKWKLGKTKAAKMKHRLIPAVTNYLPLIKSHSGQMTDLFWFLDISQINHHHLLQTNRG